MIKIIRPLAILSERVHNFTTEPLADAARAVKGKAIELKDEFSTEHELKEADRQAKKDLREAQRQIQAEARELARAQHAEEVAARLAASQEAKRAAVSRAADRRVAKLQAQATETVEA